MDTCARHWWMPRTIVCCCVSDPMPDGDTEDVEGLNRVKQATAMAMLASKHSLHSDRLTVKFGDGSSTAECCDLYHQVVRYQNTMGYA